MWSQLSSGLKSCVRTVYVLERRTEGRQFGHIANRNKPSIHPVPLMLQRLVACDTHAPMHANASRAGLPYVRHGHHRPHAGDECAWGPSVTLRERPVRNLNHASGRSHAYCTQKKKIQWVSGRSLAPTPERRTMDASLVRAEPCKVEAVHVSATDGRDSRPARRATHFTGRGWLAVHRPVWRWDRSELGRRCTCAVPLGFPSRRGIP